MVYIHIIKSLNLFFTTTILNDVYEINSKHHFDFKIYNPNKLEKYYFLSSFVGIFLHIHQQHYSNDVTPHLTNQM